MTIQRPLDSEELVSTGGERAVLEAFLDSYRAVLTGKLRGLSEDDARRRLVPSRTTLLGLVGHAAAVERNWFQHYLGQRPRDEIVGNATGDAASWEVGPDETVADVVAEYAAVCVTSRRIAAGLALDDTVPHDRLGRVSLRYVYVHMIRELARHSGHADILREQIDGATGD
ncbi:MAG: DinB family protein [Actinocatenispora sp.]